MLSTVIAPAIAAAVELTGVPSIKMRAYVAPAPPIMGATLRAIAAILVVHTMAATPIVSSSDRRKTVNTSGVRSCGVKSAAN